MLQHAWTVTTRGHRILDTLWTGMEEVCTPHVTTRVNCDNTGTPDTGYTTDGHGGSRYPTCYNTRELWQHGDTGYWINYGRAWRRYIPHMLQHAWTVTTRGHRILDKLRKGMEEVGTPHVTTRVNCDNTGTPDTGYTTEGHGGGMYPTCYNTRKLWQHGDTGYLINYGRAWRR